MKIKRLILIALLLVLVGGAYYFNMLLPIITGYSAKNLASGVFVAGRTQEAMESEDLNFSFIKYNQNKVDWEKKEVVSQFLWDKSTAIHIDGFGCTLVNDAKEEEILNRTYQHPEILPENPEILDWPMGDVATDSIPEGVNMNQLDAVIDQAFSDTVPSKGTFAVTVVYKGQPIVERYREDMTPETRFLSWSMAKSFTNAIVGILTKEGRLDIDKPLEIEEWQNDERKNITLNHLMHMNSGLEWNENYGNTSDVNNMLHKEGNMGEFTYEKPAVYPPDSVWLYSSGSTNLVSLIIRNIFNNDAAYYAFPREALFNKIGMRSAIWEVDASGTFVGSSYLYATMRDYARFGLLFLNNGNWMGEQILPEKWVDYTVTPANGSEGQYGSFFWLNQSGTDYPDVPRDMYCCRGHDGQYIYIIPSKELVVVRTGFSKKGEFDFNQFLSGITNSIQAN